MGIARRIVEPELQLPVLQQKALSKGFSPAGSYPAETGLGFGNQFSFDPAHGFLSETSAGFFPCLVEF
jgi:hypothetical protein